MEENGLRTTNPHHLQSPPEQCRLKRRASLETGSQTELCWNPPDPPSFKPKPLTLPERAYAQIRTSRILGYRPVYQQEDACKASRTVFLLFALRRQEKFYIFSYYCIAVSCHLGASSRRYLRLWWRGIPVMVCRQHVRQAALWDTKAVLSAGVPGFINGSGGPGGIVSAGGYPLASARGLRALLGRHLRLPGRRKWRHCRRI